jgi:hypothetical protein
VLFFDGFTICVYLRFTAFSWIKIGNPTQSIGKACKWAKNDGFFAMKCPCGFWVSELSKKDTQKSGFFVIPRAYACPRVCVFISLTSLYV